MAVDHLNVSPKHIVISLTIPQVTIKLNPQQPTKINIITIAAANLLFFYSYFVPPRLIINRFTLNMCYIYTRNNKCSVNMSEFLKPIKKKKTKH